MSRYEGFLDAVVKDFDSRVQVIQKSAEENMKAYEAYCGELKRQLEVVSAERDQLQQKVELQRSNVGEGVMDLLQQMTALSVSVKSSNESEVVYQCQLLEGAMAGLAFSLSLSKTSWEYKYEPCSSDERLPDPFMSTLYFPDYMLSRFLTSLLNATYSKSLQ